MELGELGTESDGTLLKALGGINTFLQAMEIFISHQHGRTNLQVQCISYMAYIFQ